ncbi:transcriptional regulator [candidate division WOR-1 bacterium DG_54_3]|uniref:Transcriptional regulator n=1 Tax=candidate division WOR-1 bacterium DG_54_3 TaxID=1703775 RepID=A0A0S7Y590_UNCSA|nr:MAG: transcriptional regulator [candidate division WOR-1 bacterium DG_54_3]
MSVPFFDITRQNQAVKQELDAAIERVIKSGRFILGESVCSLEKEIASYCGVAHAIGVASGTDALHLALRACGVKPGDEVITSPFTFVATAEAIAYCGANPVFVDIEPKTYNIDPSLIEKSITKKTKAILPIHLYGQACEMDQIMQIARKNDLAVIEDCAQAIGAEYNNAKVGSFGEAGCFSFFPTKNLGCFGDGGMVITDNEKIAVSIMALRGHGSRKTYHYDIIGYNSRLDELQATILSIKLQYLGDFSRSRRKNAGLYQKGLKELAQLTLPYELPSAKHVFNQFTIRVKERDALYEFLRVKGIGAMVYYPLSLHLQKAFESLGHKPGDFPESESAQNEVLSLPVFPELEAKEIEQVCAAIKEFYKQ